MSCSLFPSLLKWSCSVVCDSLQSHGLYSLSGSSVHGIFQARVLQWVAISFSRESSQLRDRTQVSCTAGRCFTIWATRNPPIYVSILFQILFPFKSLQSVEQVSLCNTVDPCWLSALNIAVCTYHGFSIRHVRMSELDYKEGWTLKNWCFRAVILQKTLESSLDCKEIKPVNPKGNQSEYSLEGLMLKLKLQYFGHLMWKANSLENTLMLEKIELKLSFHTTAESFFLSVVLIYNWDI